MLSFLQKGVIVCYTLISDIGIYVAAISYIQRSKYRATTPTVLIYPKAKS